MRQHIKYATPSPNTFPFENTNVVTNHHPLFSVTGLAGDSSYDVETLDKNRAPMNGDQVFSGSVKYMLKLSFLSHFFAKCDKNR